MGFALICFVIVGFGIYLLISGIKKAEETKIALEEKLKNNNFITTKVLDNGSGMVLYVDDISKRWFVQYNSFDNTPHFFNYADLLEFEVYEDGNSVAKGRAGSALVGGLLFGSVGAAVGASRQKSIKSTCSTLQVRICVKDINFPEIIIPFIETETQKDSFVYKTMFDLAKKFAATLAYIENGKEIDFTDNGVPKGENTNSSAGELEKYFELKEKGIITEEEFDEKKKQLLNL